MRAGIALGSNLGDRLENLRHAWQEVLNLPGVSEPSCHSQIYETSPVGTQPGAGMFLNAVGEVEFAGHPSLLLEALLGLEARMGRPSRRPRNASRVIDLDLLYAGNSVLSTDRVMIPHPRLHLRRFVLQPLNDIRPELRLPGHEATIAELLGRLPPYEECVNLIASSSLI